jgi:hypothetical protein
MKTFASLFLVVAVFGASPTFAQSLEKRPFRLVLGSASQGKHSLLFSSLSLSVRGRDRSRIRWSGFYDAGGNLSGYIDDGPTELPADEVRRIQSTIEDYSGFGVHAETAVRRNFFLGAGLGSYHALSQHHIAAPANRVHGLGGKLTARFDTGGMFFIEAAWIVPVTRRYSNVLFGLGVRL